MAGYFENFSRGPVHLVHTEQWHRRNEEGEKVRGNHKASTVTDAPDVLAEKAGEEKMKQLAGKLNNMLRNIGSKTSSYDYKAEANKWGEAFKIRGGRWSDAQERAINMSLKKNPGNRDWFDAFRHNFHTPEVDNGIGHPEAAVPDQVEEPMIVDDPAPMVAKRPEDTPRREPEEIKRRRLHAGAAEARATSTTEQAVSSSPASIEVPAVVEAPPVAVESIEVDPVAGMAGGGGAVAVDPSGSLPFETIESHPPRVSFKDNKQFFTFGGSRIMYSWAYEFFPGKIPGVNNISANINDGVIVGHAIPWEWIPFYCTPGEYAMLPFGQGDVYIDKVRLRVTPMAKETQFTTNGATSGVASQEHLCLGKVVVGLNHKWPNTAILRAKEGATVANAQMSFSAAGVSKVDYGDLSKRYWGNLSNWTSGVSPYGNPTTTSGGTVTNGTPRSTMEMNIREIETVQLMLWDQWDTTTQGNNSSCWGVPLLDRFVKRFPFMSAIGKPIVDEEYVPKNGCISYVPHISLLSKDDYNSAKFFGKQTATSRQANTFSVNNRDSVIATTDTYVARNANIGTKQSILGSYHGCVEKQSFMPHCSGGYASENTNYTMPSVCIGMEPIKPIDFSTSLGVPIQARAMWKIDYQIIFRCERPEHIYHWPYPTHIKPSAGIVAPLANVQKSGPAICRRNAIPEKAIFPLGYDSSSAGYPSYEEPSVEHVMCQNIFGKAIYKAADSNNTLVDVAGASYTDPANLGANGFRTTSDP